MRPFVDPRGAVSVILVGLVVLYLNLVWRMTRSFDRLVIDSLFCGVILFTVWNRTQKAESRSGRNSCPAIIGYALLGLLLIKSLSLFWFETAYLMLFPIVAAFSLVLVTSGFRGLPRYALQFLLVGLMVLPVNSLTTRLEQSAQIAAGTAKFSGLILQLIGFDVSQHGNVISLPSGTVTVGGACTGIGMFLLLLKLVLLGILVVPMTNWQRGGLLLTSLAVSFVISSMRIAFMAVAVADSQRFEFWHGSTGAEIFSTVSMVSFGLLSRLVMGFKPRPPALSPTRTVERTSFPASDSAWRPVFLGLCSAAVCLFTVHAFLNPEIGKRDVHPFVFPERATIAGWQFLDSNPLRSETNGRDELPYLIPSARHYRFAGRDTVLDVEMRYVVGVWGRLGLLVQDQTAIPVKVFRKGEIRNRPEAGATCVFSSNGRAYLTACINVQGLSTVTSRQFLENRGLGDLSWRRILAWIKGGESLRECRWVWALLSLPMDGKNPERAFERLEMAWTDWYERWPARFPSL